MNTEVEVILRKWLEQGGFTYDEQTEVIESAKVKHTQEIDEYKPPSVN